MKLNQFEWGWQQQHLPTCQHHQLIAQCQLNDVKPSWQEVEGHGFAFVRHEISHLLEWPQKTSHTTLCKAVLSPP